MFVKKSELEQAVKERDNLKLQLTGQLEKLNTIQEALKIANEEKEALAAKVNELENSDAQKALQSLNDHAAALEKEHKQQLETLNSEMETLRSEKETLNTSVSAKDKEITQLKQTVNDLNETITRLNDEAGEQAREAHTNSDGNGDNTVSLENFCKNNHDDKQAIFARFEEMGL